MTYIFGRYKIKISCTEESMHKDISKVVLQRLPVYLNYLKTIPEKDGYISATVLASRLNLGEVQVRKDLASVSCAGKPKVGYEVKTLISELESALGYDNTADAVIIGAGHLGMALLDYKGFEEYGFNIVAGFDRNEKVWGKTEGGKPVFAMEKLPSLIARMHIKIGIVTVPATAAQEVCDLLVENGILAVWNFTAAHLNVPDGILVRNENMAVSLSLLVQHLTDNK